MERKLKIGIVGLGNRGLATVRRYRYIERAEIAAVCDVNRNALDTAVSIVPHAVKVSFWEELCRNEAIDLVYICTDWESHARIAIGAMKLGKDVAVEVPAATTLGDCRLLLATVRETGRTFTMMENCCYDPFALFTLQIAREGLLGDIVHCEGAYIHDLREMTAGTWYEESEAVNRGNPYPTHGIGPICQLLGIGRNDRFEELTSMTSTAGGRQGVNSSLLRTERGVTVLLQHDVTTPRPYSRLQTVCGTKGYASKYPVPMVMFDGMSEPLTGQALEDFMVKHRHPLVEGYEEEGKRLGVENMMNYIMDRRLVDTLLAGNKPDITPEDAVLWSSLSSMTDRSVRSGGCPVSIPRFY